mmetsp:Transcript_1948/g.6225  ORF Transcript_1948/g.6225 Transcript_1948/m.6225 type:complete len:208 (+) Transcript_1948:686-1309(+)
MQPARGPRLRAVARRASRRAWRSRSCALTRRSRPVRGAWFRLAMRWPSVAAAAASDVSLPSVSSTSSATARTASGRITGNRACDCDGASAATAARAPSTPAPPPRTTAGPAAPDTAASAASAESAAPAGALPGTRGVMQARTNAAESVPWRAAKLATSRSRCPLPARTSKSSAASASSTSQSPGIAPRVGCLDVPARARSRRRRRCR